MATAAQSFQYNEHRAVCQDLGIPQSTLQHKSLQGSLSSPSTTGVQTYAPATLTTVDPGYTSTSVWAVWKQQEKRGDSGSYQIGRGAVQQMIGQFPTLDDTGTAVAVQHDDWLVDSQGFRYRILEPTTSPDGGFWMMELVRQR